MGGRLVESSYDYAAVLQNLVYGRGGEYITTVLVCSGIPTINILVPRVLYAGQDDYVEQRRCGFYDRASHLIGFLFQLNQWAIVIAHIFLAPASLSTRAASSRVAPVVLTSSRRMTVLFLMTSGWFTANVPMTFCLLSEAVSSICGFVGFIFWRMSERNSIGNISCKRRAMRSD